MVLSIAEVWRTMYSEEKEIRSYSDTQRVIQVQLIQEADEADSDEGRPRSNRARSLFGRFEYLNTPLIVPSDVMHKRKVAKRIDMLLYQPECARPYMPQAINAAGDTI